MNDDARSFFRLYTITQAVWALVFIGVALKFGCRHLALILVGQIFINASFGFVDGENATDKFRLAKRFLAFTNVLAPLEAFVILLVK